MEKKDTFEDENEESKFYIKSALDRMDYHYIDNLDNNFSYFLYFSKMMSCSREISILKLHILLGVKNPEIYLLPLGNNIAFSLHDFCEICSKWLKLFINEGKDTTGKNKSIIIESNYQAKNKVIIVLSPNIEYLKYLKYDNSKEIDKYFIEYTNTDIIFEGKGNVYASVSIKESFNKNDKNAYDKIKEEIEKSLIDINNVYVNILYRRFSLYISFTSGIAINDYIKLMPINYYNKLKKLSKGLTLCDIPKEQLIMLIIDKIKRHIYNTNIDIETENFDMFETYNIKHSFDF